ncbi:hypothetical protein [Streptomyces sp. NBC_01216]|nr:hypothetical protein OG393_02055 [Streptomyces sp. NBC_01216]
MRRLLLIAALLPFTGACGMVRSSGYAVPSPRWTWIRRSVPR